MGRKRDKIIKEYLASPLKAGDRGSVPEKLFRSYASDDKMSSVTIMKKLPDGRLIVRLNDGDYGSRYPEQVEVDEAQFTRSTFWIGANPFPVNVWRRKIESVNFDLEQILWRMDVEFDGHKKTEYEVAGRKVPNINFNPYVYTPDGGKHYYQRPFCWKLKDKQSFIESIYLGINCGMVLVRERGWSNVEAEVKRGSEDIAFFDIIDGKQRIECLASFVQDGFKDLHGNYFSDLSDWSQMQFLRSQSLTYGRMKDVTDEETIQAFLNVNYTGVPMSKEHIEYVRQIGREMSGNKE